MSKTLHFVIRVTVPDFRTVAQTQWLLTWLLNRTPTMQYDKPRVWRPRGKLGVLLRKLDNDS